MIVFYLLLTFISLYNPSSQKQISLSLSMKKQQILLSSYNLSLIPPTILPSTFKKMIFIVGRVSELAESAYHFKHYEGPVAAPL